MKFSSEWFRRNQKKFLGIFVVVLMAAWGIGPAINMLTGPSGNKPVGTIFGEEISSGEFNDAIKRWHSVFLQQLNSPVYETVWKQLMLVREAKRFGIKVSDNEVLEGVRMMSEGLMGEQVNMPVQHLIIILCNSFGVADYQLTKTIREALLIEKLERFIKDSIKISTEEAWQQYSRENEQAKVKYIALSAKDIADHMRITESEVQTFYDEHRENLPNTFEGVTGYKEEEKVQIEYIMARYEDLKTQVTVSEEEIREYYDINKNTKYKVIEETPDTETPSDEAESGLENETTPTYKPLEEVREEIENTLKSQKAEALAIELIDKVDARITTELGTTERTSFEELAREQSLTYIITPYFDKKKANIIIRGTDKLYQKAFGREERDPTPPYDSAEGRFIFQVVGKKAPGAPLLIEITDRVERDLRVEKALRKLREIAGRHTENKQDNDFDKVAKAIEKELFEIVKQEPTVVRRGSESQKLTIEHSETDYFSRPMYSGDTPFRLIPAMKGNRPNVASRAFDLKDGEIAVVVEEKGEKTCYVIALLDKKEADRAKFDEEKDLIIKKYLGEKQNTFMTQWVDTLSQNTELQTRYSQ